MIRVSMLALALTLSLSACGKKKEEAAGGAASKGTEAKAEAKKGGGATKLPKLGLQLDAPGDVTVGDAVMGEGHMLQGAGIGAMQIEVADKKRTIDDAKSDADMYSPKDFKADTLTDGFAATYSNTGSMGANYFVDVQRDIGGKTYHCSTTGSDPKQAAAVLAACKSLRQ